MADHAEVALRLLEPRWTTIAGTVRQFQDMAVERDVRRGQGWYTAAVGGAPPIEPVEDYEGWRRVWLHRDGRSRIEHFAPGAAPYATVIDEGVGHRIELVEGAPPAVKQSFLDPITWVGDAISALAGQRVQVGESLTYAGRPAVELVLTPRPGRGVGPAPSTLGLPLGDQNRLVVDVASGVALRMASFVGDRLFALQQFTEVEIDGPVDEALLRYDPPEGVQLRGPGADLLDHLRARGVDVDDVDPFDMAAVHRAVQERRPSGPPPGWRAPPRPRRLPELVIPLGPLPDDLGAAEQEVHELFGRLGPDAAGHTERGEQLRPALEQAGRRIGAGGGRPARWTCTELAFVREDEALVRFTVQGPTGPRVPGTGRVVRRDGRWLLSYESVAALVGMAGVRVPRADGTDDDGDEGDERTWGPGPGPHPFGPGVASSLPEANSFVLIERIGTPADPPPDDGPA